MVFRVCVNLLCFLAPQKLKVGSYDSICRGDNPSYPFTRPFIGPHNSIYNVCRGLPCMWSRPSMVLSWNVKGFSTSRSGEPGNGRVFWDKIDKIWGEILRSWFTVMGERFQVKHDFKFWVLLDSLHNKIWMGDLFSSGCTEVQLFPLFLEDS